MQQAVFKNQVSQRQNFTNFREVSPESEEQRVWQSQIIKTQQSSRQSEKNKN